MTQEPKQSNAKRPLADQLRLTFPLLIACAFSMAALVAVFNDNGQTLTPEPEAIAIWGEVIGVTLGVLSCAVVMGVRPRTWQTILIAIGGSTLTTILCWLISWNIISQVYQHATFSGGNVKSRRKDIPILVAEINHYRGTHYNVWLESYSALLEVEESDYVTAFGRVERTRPIGYCVHATVQTSGSASRVMAGRGMALPVGSVERCPSLPQR